jgi:hypothetical protein
VGAGEFRAGLEQKREDVPRLLGQQNRIDADMFSGFAASLPNTAWMADSPSITPIRPVGHDTMKSGSNPCPAMA